MNPDGSGKTNLTKTPEADEDDPTWSPDGTKMAYTRSYDDSSGKRVFDIWTMNADGSGQTRLAAGAGGAGDLGTQNSAPDWSPTDDRIAFERIEVTVREGTDYDIWTINADGSGPRDLTDDASPTGDSQASPDWSPDGSKIAFTSFAYYQSGPNCLGSGIYTMNSDGSGQARITNKVSQACDASEWRDDGDSQWSPGGGKIAFYSRPDIWTVNADGSGQTRVTNTPNTWEALFDWGLYDPPDTTKPSVSAPRPKPGSVTRDRTPTISATVKDNLTNLSRDNITLRVAGKRVSTFAYDCATDKLTYTPKRLTKGKKTVSIAATDAALNVGTKS
jgi:Tol biopolymer transport system component